MNRRKEEEGQEQRRKKFQLRGLIYHNSFVLVVSFIAAMVGWFVVADGSNPNSVVYDVPIEFTRSPEAEADGLRVFHSTHNTVDIEVAGSSYITSGLSAEDFVVTAALSPSSTKLTGNTTQKMTAQVRCSKRSAATDYTVVSVSPEEVTLEYDRFKEISLPIENKVEYTVGTGLFPGTPVLSSERVNVSGPESSVNKISRVAVALTLENPLRENYETSCPLRFYDQDGQEITDTASLYLTADVEEVGVNIPVYPKKTVPLVVTMAHQPSGFSNTRIKVEPESIDLAGSAETLGTVTEIRLDNLIDFADLDLSKPTAVFTLEIPIPQNTRDITSTGNNTLSQATVTINLNGYRETTLTVPESNIQLINAPATSLITRSIDVRVAGPEAQINRLTGDSLIVQVDMSSVNASSGSVDVPATVTIPGSAGEACWVLGSYTAAVSVGNAENTVSVQSRDFAAVPPSD